MKSIKEIKNELLSAFISLENSYRNNPRNTTDADKKISYLDIELCEHLLNGIKALEYHYRDDIPDMNVKRNWNEEMVRAHKLLKKYSIKTSNNFDKLKLKREFDDSGYLKHRDFFEEASNKREDLKS
jgi:hypothetical protein